MNPYEPCCWNKKENGKQITVVFHVNDMKLSHEDKIIVKKHAKKLEGVYATKLIQ